MTEHPAVNAGEDSAVDHPTAGRGRVSGRRQVSADAEGTPEFSLWKDSDDFATLNEIRRAAQARLPGPVWDFIEGGAGDEATMEENRLAFGRWHFRPRYQCGVKPAELRTTFLGSSLSMPVLTCPFGMDSLYNPDGFLAVARAHERAGTAFAVSFGSSFSLEAVAEAAPTAAKLFNIVPNGEVETFVKMARRARAAGYLALVVTVDGPPAGWRERQMEGRFVPDIATIAGHFRLPTGEIDVPAVRGFGLFEGPQWTWAKLGDACAQCDLPFTVKGVMTAEDARAAVDIGASAVWVSNHGGRQLDGLPAALTQLPEVVAEIGPDAEIVLDGGVRRGTDVLKALALGAAVVGIGRLSAYGLAASGENGVLRVLDLLRDELAVSLALCGRSSVAAVDRTMLQPAAR